MLRFPLPGFDVQGISCTWEYALETLVNSRELEPTQEAHAMYYFALAEHSKPEFFGLEEGEGTVRMRAGYEGYGRLLRRVAEAPGG